MCSPRLHALALTFSTGLATFAIASAADSPGSAITLYRSDSNALYGQGEKTALNEGHAVIREQRPLNLRDGLQQVVIDTLPDFLDPEAITLAFSGNQTEVLSQRLLLANDYAADIAQLVGTSVEVLGDNGQPLATGTLLRGGKGDGLLVRDSSGRSTLIGHFAAIRSNQSSLVTGTRLQLQLQAHRAGPVNVALSYPTGGLGWQAAYVATLEPGNACRMRFESRASVANRSGRDWNHTQLTLIAGEPSFKSSGPRPVMFAAKNMRAAPPAPPRQSTMDNYRSYTLPEPIDLPDGSVSQLPLYETRTLDCARTELYETGRVWQPAQPVLDGGFSQDDNATVISTLQWRAFDSLPAGNLRVLALDKQATPQFIGEGRIEDTAKDGDASITLGSAFDLRVQRERTAFHVDKAAHDMDESFRLTLTNSSDTERVITVRDHPSRWSQWTVNQSSSKPVKQTPDTLEFRIPVPGNAATTLDYSVHYQWAADQAIQ